MKKKSRLVKAIMKDQSFNRVPDWPFQREPSQKHQTAAQLKLGYQPKTELSLSDIQYFLI